MGSSPPGNILSCRLDEEVHTTDLPSSRPFLQDGPSWACARCNAQGALDDCPMGVHHMAWAHASCKALDSTGLWVWVLRSRAGQHLI